MHSLHVRSPVSGTVCVLAQSTIVALISLPIPLTTGCIENDKDTFLDLDITLEENRFITKIYNKVDDFDFEVVSFPFPTSNMSVRPYHL